MEGSHSPSPPDTARQWPSNVWGVGYRLIAEPNGNGNRRIAGVDDAPVVLPDLAA